MNPSHTTSITSLLLPLLAFTTLPHLSNAQDNDTCSFPVGPKASIGSLSFSSALSTTPLTWFATIRHHNEEEPHPSFRRQYHLFTADQSLKFGNDSDFNGCAFALTGVMKTDRTAMTPELDGQGDRGCGVMLGEECAKGVVDRAKQMLDEALRNATDSDAAAVCDSVGQSLFASARPEGCDVNVWASVLNIALTGPGNDVLDANSTEEGPEPDCEMGWRLNNEEGGHTFSLFPGFPTFDVPDDGSLADAAEWIRASTPLLSVFWSKEGSTRTDLDEPELELNCIAAANDTAASTEGDSSSGGSNEGDAAESAAGSAAVQLGGLTLGVLFAAAASMLL